MKLIFVISYFAGMGLIIFFIILSAKRTLKFRESLKVGDWVKVETDCDEFYGTVIKTDGKTVTVLSECEEIDVDVCLIYKP